MLNRLRTRPRRAMEQGQNSWGRGHISGIAVARDLGDGNAAPPWPWDALKMSVTARTGILTPLIGRELVPLAKCTTARAHPAHPTVSRGRGFLLLYILTARDEAVA